MIAPWWPPSRPRACAPPRPTFPPALRTLATPSILPGMVLVLLCSVLPTPLSHASLRPRGAPPRAPVGYSPVKRDAVSISVVVRDGEKISSTA
eukprot:4384941-Pyramimonas_sp.AAC.1